MRLKLWTRDGLQYTSLTFGVAAFYTLMITLQQSLSWEDILAVFPLYLSLMGGLMAVVCAMTVHRVQLHVAISLGLTRRESRCKWSGRGLTLPVRDIAVPLPPAEELDGLRFRSYAGAGWAASLCGTVPPPQAVRWVELVPPNR